MQCITPEDGLCDKKKEGADRSEARPHVVSEPAPSSLAPFTLSLSLLENLSVLREAGLSIPAVLWLEYREAVTGGVKEA